MTFIAFVPSKRRGKPAPEAKPPGAPEVKTEPSPTLIGLSTPKHPLPPEKEGPFDNRIPTAVSTVKGDLDNIIITARPSEKRKPLSSTEVVGESAGRK
jgi:hypothetical protein